MRLIFIVFLLALVGGVGWIAGSLHPAPPAILDPIKNAISGQDETTAEILDRLDTSTETNLEIATDEPERSPDPVEPDPSPDPESETSTDPIPVVFENQEAALAQYRVWISEARAVHPYPDSEDRMFDVMMCESGGNPEIVNPAGPYTGLFQYVAGTWDGDWNTYRDQAITDARAQIFATALAWNLGMQSHWGCYTRAH
ncbi:MAG: hypothetical protein HRT81_13080 [Henriciella sp.]|nr:hypothetical protein [Henriciella sp.]